MKKNIIIYLVLIISIFTGCQKQLDLLPEDTLNPDNYFSNATELRLWTNRFYALFDGADELAGQNADDNVDNSLGDVIQGQRDPASESGWTWSMLRSINYYLQNSSNSKDLNAKKNYDGIAYFFRAYFYWEKVRRYGDVPWYNQVLKSDDDALLFKPREDRGLIMDSIMSDLDKAIAQLPTAKNNVTVTKWTALALKTRIALYEGTYRKYHGLSNAEKYLQQVVSAGEDFIANSGYNLYRTGTEPYRTLFNSDNAVSDEIILTRIYSTTPNLTNGVPFNISNTKQGFTKRFMNHYLLSNGDRITTKANWASMQFVEEMSNRDPRLKQTVLAPGYIQKGQTAVKVNNLNAITGYQPIKFVAETAYDGAGKAVSDWPLFRAAEVFLNFAEAKAELGNLTQADLDKSINKIKARANMPDLNLTATNANPDNLLLEYYPNITKGANLGVLLEIRRERTIELVMEGFRQWDLFRWKEGAQFTKTYYGIYFPGPGFYDMDGNGSNDLVLWTGARQTIPGGTSKEIGKDIILSEGNSGYIVAYPTITRNWNEGRDYLWPIPSDQRVITKGALTQNPGWNDSSGY